jgi:hypothetical protein
VATVKSKLQRKLERALTKRFPPPATVKLQDHNGIIGVITSDEFAPLESIDRQALIAKLVESCLTPEERRQVQIIVGVTHDEETGYLAGVD